MNQDQFELALAAHEIHLWSVRASQPAPDELAWLTQEERARGNRFVQERHRVSHLATRCLVRRVLSRYAPVPPEGWCFDVNQWGRPGVSQPVLDDAIYFNVSHSGPHILMVVSRQSAVGVDVETRLPGDVDRIAADQFASAEVDWLNGDAARFLCVWTLKEAYIKARGLGLSMPLDSFAVLPDDQDGAQLLSSADEPDPARWKFWRGALEHEGKWAVAACGGGELELIRMTD